ncbi:acyl carrier protein [Shimia ponticola]|uniref:acyl carrier protein n=1 Tax=Shimia ponticola TaxID=2582893 RepID=UPI0011BF7CBA|nr:acyl carrier protein [Shimia ponticola]
MAQPQTVEEQVRGILAEQAMLDLDDVTTESTLEDLGLDSLGLVEVIFAIEETFDVQVPFNANEPDKSEFDISSVQKIVDGVQSLIDAKT